MKVSIVMPMYNALPYVKASVESVLKQTHSDWELLIIDDCSSDGSSDVASTFANSDLRIRYVKNTKNLGVAETRNVALNMATGGLVAFLDSDDCWLPDKLALQVKYMCKNQAKITYSSYARYSEAGVFLGVVHPKANIGFKDMLYRNQIGNLTGMYLRSALPALRFKNTGHEDYLFWAEAIKTVGTASLTPSDKPLANYLVRDNSLSGNKFKAALWQWNNYRANLKLSFIDSVYYFSCYALVSVYSRITARKDIA
ncbi:glycosyltransferase family 2 protein [Pseudomonas sp. RL_15y_Pfl2_60]|uniref:glycosyltransferase family 2 protein n=1 Tax=Pseudomonas sp. RL_15y_Pfl2_60 TaxID=3088709 RepID=UPI0030D6FB1D